MAKKQGHQATRTKRVVLNQSHHRRCGPIDGWESYTTDNPHGIFINQIVSAPFRGFSRIFYKPPLIATYLLGLHIYIHHTYGPGIRILDRPRIIDLCIHQRCPNPTPTTYVPDGMGSHPHTPRAIGPEWYPQGPPLGYKPGQTRAPLIWNLVVPLGVIAVFLACLRFYVRACVVKDFGKDDWLLLATVIALLVLLSGEVWGTVLGIGKHQYDLHYIGVYGPAMVVCCSVFFTSVFGVGCMRQMVLT